MNRSRHEIVQSALASALGRDLPENGLGSRPTLCEVSVITRDQVWPFTALGFGGLGMRMMTTAVTVVVMPRISGGKACVYFGDRFAYLVSPENPEFRADLAAGALVSVRTAAERYSLSS